MTRNHQIGYARGLLNAERRGATAARLNVSRDKCPYSRIAHRQSWLAGFDKEKKRAGKSTPRSFTVLCCDECRKAVGLSLDDRVGGTITELERSGCQLCGKVTGLGEYRTNISPAAIRADMV